MLKSFYGRKIVIIAGLFSSMLFAAEPRVDYEAFALPTDLSAEIITTPDGILPSGETQQDSTVATPTVEEQSVETVTPEVIVEQVEEEEAPQVLVETEIVTPETEVTKLVVEDNAQPSEQVVEEILPEVQEKIVTETETAVVESEAKEIEVVIEEEVVVELSSEVAQDESVVTEEQDQKVDEDLIILNWATAWSNNDTETYLSFYADRFMPENSNQNRAEWEKIRRERLKNQDIRIVVSNAELYRTETDLIEVRFTQRYTSKKYRDRVIKSIEMINTPDGWKFISERVIEKLAFE